jgi:class III poly(R)-hydroxyalkanoic acid synthase PhaE subunit
MSAATPDFSSFDPARMAEQVMGFWTGLARPPQPAAPASPFAAFQQMFGAPQPQSMPGADLFAHAQQMFGRLQQALLPALETPNFDVDSLMQMWRKTFGDGSMLPPALMVPSFMAPMAAGGSPGFAAEMRGALGSAPLGLMREHQERLQAFAQAQIDLQSAFERYGTLMQKVQREGMVRFEIRLRERSEPGKQMESVRAVFDLWIDACEEAFAEAALSPEYRHIYGELVNAQMRARQCGMAIVEEQLKSLGLPSRTELDSNHKRTYELQRELRALKLRVAELEQAPKSAPAAEPLAARPVKSAAAAPAAARPAKPVAAAPARAKPRSKPAKPASKSAAKRVVKASASRKKSLPPLAAVMPKAPARARKGR